MTRAANMQALTNDVKREWPGVVVYGIGDTAHKTRASDHNEDDTSGSKAAQSDPDGRAEHRAIDIMVRGPFSKATADALVARLVADPKARARLFYIIWHGYIWSRSNGWARKKYTGTDQHTDHIHVSGWAADDENTATWPAVAKTPVASVEDDMTPEQDARLKRVEDKLTQLDGREPIGQAYLRLAVGKDDTAGAKPVGHPTLTSLDKQLRALVERPAVAIDYDALAEALLKRVLTAGTTPQS
ncbi:hypothetical protein PSN13_06488 [Micromonospora saelicesensis]|uniref:ARB-07466-like C-terminal domain-containing protein n=1 Tax=Micromonospora saelicesensis TaxID=285676 RepID=A0A328NGU5_9ACTN|nr:hypothetical protein [Micromonospora saelicesensis]RAO26460.1 hypothetical protein PSN13_06488 [Micromonospora saelicesensis]